MKTKHDVEDLKQRTQSLGLFGLLAHFGEIKASEWGWIRRLIEWEEGERQRRSLERRLRNARLGDFKPMADFDWKWPRRCDREAIEEVLTLDFVTEGANLVVVGPNGVGKSMVAKNVAYQAVLAGHTVTFTNASQMLNHLASGDGAAALRRRLQHYVRPQLLCVDELGYLSYDNRFADLLFEVVSRRYEAKRSTVITTNKPFAEWSDVFPNAACVVTLVDRLMHRADIIQIEGESYRLKEAKERSQKKRKSTKKHASRRTKR